MEYSKMIKLLVISLFITLCHSRTPLSLPFNLKTLSTANLNKTATGEALFITPLLEQGKIKEAQKYSHIWGISKALHMHSGYITVNKQYNSNLFFWFIRAESRAPNAPVVVWLQGGPGGSSMFGLFGENGPLYITKDLKPHRRRYSWTHGFNMLFIDQPAGTGFSFTENDAGYATNQTDVANDLYNFLQQFFTLFPDLSANDFYVTGESYAGKYVPAISYKIHKENQSAKKQINFKGMAIGDGLCDPVSMLNYGDLLYQIGLVDRDTRDEFHRYQDSIKQLITQGKYLDAFKDWDLMLDGLLANGTGFTNYFNFLYSSPRPDMDYYSNFMNLERTRKAIHVGGHPFNDISQALGGGVAGCRLQGDVLQWTAGHHSSISF